MRGVIPPCPHTSAWFICRGNFTLYFIINWSCTVFRLRCVNSFDWVVRSYALRKNTSVKITEDFFFFYSVYTHLFQNEIMYKNLKSTVGKINVEKFPAHYCFQGRVTLYIVQLMFCSFSLWKQWSSDLSLPTRFSRSLFLLCPHFINIETPVTPWYRSKRRRLRSFRFWRAFSTNFPLCTKHFRGRIHLKFM
jgi:hypothetical protein